MKIHFIKSNNPNIFSRLVEVFEGPYTHVAVETDLKIPGSDEPFLLEASWKSGCVLTPKKELLDDAESITFEDGVDLNWNKIRILMRRRRGVFTYGWAQSLGTLLRYLNIKEPNWLITRYRSESFCSQLVLDIWKAHGKKYLCEDYRTGPGRLLASVRLDSEIIQI